MPFQFERVRSPEGVEDSTVIDFENMKHFIASFGSEIRIFNNHYTVFAFKTKFYVQKILPFQRHYFLIGKECYCLCKDKEILYEVKFNQIFGRILKILSLKNSFVFIFDQKKFLTGTINNFRLEFDSKLTDNHFFNVVSAAACDDKINLLVSTYSKLYMILYTTEGHSCLKFSRKEIQNGNILISRNDDFLLFDEQGMWQYGTKQTFIKEFANYKISSSVDDQSRTIVFCENGEVIVINRDNSHYTVGTLDCPITSVSAIGDLFFCTSILYSYFLKISDSIEIVHSFGSFNLKENLLSLKFDSQSRNLLPYLLSVSPKSFKRVEYLVQSSSNHRNRNSMAGNKYANQNNIIGNESNEVNCSTQNNLISKINSDQNLKDKEAENILKNNIKASPVNPFIYKLITLINSIVIEFPIYRFKDFSILNSNLIINFDKFSIYKKLVIQSTLGVYSYNNNDYILTENALYHINDIEIKQVLLKSETVKFYENLIFNFYENQITMINLDNLSISTLTINFQVCDFYFEKDFLYCIDINENLYILAISNFHNSKACNFEICSSDKLTYKELEIDSSVNQKLSDLQDLIKNNIDSFSEQRGSNQDLSDHVNDRIDDSEIPFSSQSREYSISTLSSFKDIQNLGKRKSSFDPSIDDIKRHLHSDSYSSRGVSNFSNFLTVNGKVYFVNDNTLSLLVDIEKFIYKVLVFRKFLVISAEQTFIFNLETKELLKASEGSIGSLILSNLLILCSKKGIVDFSNFHPKFHFESTNFHLSNSQRLIAVVTKKPIISDISVDQRDFSINFCKSSILFRESFLNCHAQLRDGLLCLGIISLEGKGRALFLSFSHKKIKIRKEIELESIPLTMCCLNDYLCIVTANSVLWYKISYGRIIFKGKILHRFICLDSQFINKNEIVLRDDDWSYHIINLKTKKISKFSTEGLSLPFVIGKQHGYGIGSQIFLTNQILDCGETINRIYSLGERVLIFCTNGTVFQLKIITEENNKSLYGNEKVIIKKEIF